MSLGTFRTFIRFDITNEEFARQKGETGRFLYVIRIASAPKMLQRISTSMKSGGRRDDGRLRSRPSSSVEAVVFRLELNTSQLPLLFSSIAIVPLFSKCSCSC